MEKISRYILVFITIAVLSVVLPKLYWLAFEQPARIPFVQYSATDNEFLILRNSDGVQRTSADGRELSREEYEQKLPFLYTRQLLMNGELPDSINGVQMDPQQINKFRSGFRLKPEDVDAPAPKLFPLFESQSGRATLEMPGDFFRIGWRMEFVDAKTLKIDEEKSRMFSAVLYKRGFRFPAKSIDGIPSPLKSCDEGYLVSDAAEQLFHVKMAKGKPFVRKVELPEGLRFKAIRCVDFSDKLYYAYLFSEDKRLYVLTQFDYQLEAFPVDDVDPASYEIRISGDLLNFNLQTIGEGIHRSVIFDRDRQKVAEYSEKLPSKYESNAGKIADLIFRAQCELRSSKSTYLNFYLRPSNTLLWLLPALLLALFHFWLIRKRKQKIKAHFIDLLIIVLTGPLGFLAVHIFPNKFYE